MLNMQEIENTIEELENGDTNFLNCQRLATLYIVRDRFKNALNELVNGENDNVTNELSDILPQYQKYIDIKRRYQMGELPERSIEISIKSVCKEISEFIHTLYSCTDMQAERDCINEMILDLQNLVI